MFTINVYSILRYLFIKILILKVSASLKKSRIRGSKRHYAIWSQVNLESDRFKTSWGDEN